MRKKGEHGFEWSLSSKEDDSSDEKERERDTMTCAWPPESRGFGVPGQCLKDTGGACLNVHSGSVGPGYSFYISNKFPGAVDAAATPHHDLSRGPEEC